MSPSHHSGSGNGSNPVKTPDNIMNDVTLLLRDLTTPETQVRFDVPSRGNPATIQNTIFPPAAYWSWPDLNTRKSQESGLTQDDVGKYGIVESNHTLYKLVRISPDVEWEAVQTFSDASWSWANENERLNEQPQNADVGKIGVQKDIDTYYKLTSVNPKTWQQVANPTSPSPLELSTGASDAVSYHDFYRLQIAFDDVWSEVTDKSVLVLAQTAYSFWDKIIQESGDYLGKRAALSESYLEKTGLLNRNITGIQELQYFIDNLKFILGISNDNTPPSESSSSAGSSGGNTDVKNALMGIIETIATVKGTIVTNLTKPLADVPDLINGVYKIGSQVQALSSQASAIDPFKDVKNALMGIIGTIDTVEGTIVTNLTKPLADVPDVIKAVYQIESQLQAQVQALSSQASPPDIDPFMELKNLITELDAMLKEPYRFDVFAPGSINYGVLFNYRQRWEPKSYQVGNLVTTIPLAPQETRRYTTKTVVKKTRSVKEIEDSLRTGKGESSNTWREDREIVERARSNSNFQQNAQGSYGNDTGLFKISAAVERKEEQGLESAQTKRDFHEAVVKASHEYRTEHRMEISTEETREDETTSYREIRNPNDELTVTYLFYELQRRYLVSEELHKIRPVILVANEVPAPDEVDQAWILRHDWIIKRAILDDSFLPALEYLSSDYTGEQVKLKVLWMMVEQQKGVVDKISQQVQLAKQVLNAATLGLTNAEDAQFAGMKVSEATKFLKSFLDPLNITQVGAPSDEGNADRARVDFAKDALNRAQAKADQLTADLTTQTTALQVAVDKYSAEATKHYSMMADINRLRVHVKDNIIHYMQAIWSYEPPDQRYFRLYNLDIPVFEHHTTVRVANDNSAVSALEPTHIGIITELPAPDLSAEPTKLHQMADLDNLLGFKGNYMIFPMLRFNYLNWYMMQEYIHVDPTTGAVTAQDPDPDTNWRSDQLQFALNEIKSNSDRFGADQRQLEEIARRLLANDGPEMVIVPSNSLYIEALPGTHPLLEDFKLIHRAIDVKKAQAEARRAELENLRLAARLANGELGDPDIDKVVVVGGDKNVTVDAGQ